MWITERLKKNIKPIKKKISIFSFSHFSSSDLLIHDFTQKILCFYIVLKHFNEHEHWTLDKGQWKNEYLKDLFFLRT